MKKRGPRLVVDNKLPQPEEETDQMTYAEFKVIAEGLIEMHRRYPEVDALYKRARKNRDRAMVMAATGLLVEYGAWRDELAARKRERLRLVKAKKP